MKKRKAIIRKLTIIYKWLEIIYNDFIKKSMNVSQLSTKKVHSHNCRQLLTIMPPNKDNPDIADLLRELTVVNFCNYDHNIHSIFLVKTCNKPNKKVMPLLNIEVFIEDIKNYIVGHYYLEEFHVFFNDYLNSKKHFDMKGRTRCPEIQNFYPCLVSVEKNHSLNLQECFNQYSQSIRNTLKSSKPLAPSLNSNHFNSSFYKNQIGSSNNEIPSNALIILTTFVFFVISIFICKLINKFHYKNKDTNKTLPMNRLMDGKSRRSNTKAQSPCSKLENCIRSFEQNCKRGK